MDARNRRLDPPLKAFYLLGGLLTAVCILVYLGSPPFVAFLNHSLADAICRRTPPASGSDAVVVVAVDEPSLDRFGQWPWPRYRLALLLERIGQSGAKSIGLDFIMAEPDRLSLHSVLEAFKEDTGHQIEIATAPGELKDNDSMLADVLSQWPCVLGFKFVFDHQGSDSSCRLHPVSHPAGIAARLSGAQLATPRHRCRLQSRALLARCSGLRLSERDDGSGRRAEAPSLIDPICREDLSQPGACHCYAGIEEPVRHAHNGQQRREFVPDR